jgi:hypothetical protein
MMNPAYDPIIAEASRRFNVPEETIRAVMAQESGGKPGAVSPKGASGMMQIMPPTYNELAGKHGLGPDRFDPHNNILAGTAYMRQLNDQFGGDWNDTFGAYNAGPGRWGLVKAGKQNAPAETTDYISRVNQRLGNGGDSVAFNPTIPRLNRPQPGQNLNLLGGVIPENEEDLTRRLDLEVDASKNYHNGVGTLTGDGQTPRQPPGPSLTGRIDDLISQLSKPGTATPPPSDLQYMMAGAQGGVQPLAGVHDRPVGIGEILGAMGGGVTQGSLKANEAQQQYRQGQYAELGALGKIEDYRTKPGKDPTAAVQNAVALGLKPGTPEWNAYIARATLPVGDGQTPAVKNAIALGYKPGTPEWNDFITKTAQPGGATVNMPVLEKEQDKEYGKELVKEYSDVRTAGMAGQNAISQLEIARKIPVTTGATAPYFAQVGAIAESLGFNRDKVLQQFGLGQASTAQEFEGVMQNLVLTKMKDQKGPQTKEDAQRIESTLASMRNTPEAKDFLLRTSQALAQRDVDRHEFYDQYRADHGTFEGAGAAWRKQIADQPMVGYNAEGKNTVFYSEFVSAMKEDNPHLSQQEIRQIWSEKYGNKAPQPDHAAQQGGAGKAIETLVTTLGPAFGSFAQQYLGIDPSATAEQIRRAWQQRQGGQGG